MIAELVQLFWKLPLIHKVEERVLICLHHLGNETFVVTCTPPDSTFLACWHQGLSRVVFLSDFVVDISVNGIICCSILPFSLSQSCFPRAASGIYWRLTYKLQRTWNLMVQIKWCWFHSKNIHICPSYGQKLHICPYLGIRFFCNFWANWAEIFHGSSGDHYLSIGDEKSKLWCLFFIFHFLGHFKQEKGRRRGHQARPLWSGASKPNQKVFEIFKCEPPLLKGTVYTYLNVRFHSLHRKVNLT